MSHVEDLKAAALRLVAQVDREMAILLASSNRLAEAHAECGEVFERSERDDIRSALVGLSEVYTELEDQAGKLGLSVHTLQAYAAGI